MSKYQEKRNRLTAKSVHSYYVTRNISFFKKVNIAYNGDDDDDDDNIFKQICERTLLELHYPRRERRQIDRYGKNIYRT